MSNRKKDQFSPKRLAATLLWCFRSRCQAKHPLANTIVVIILIIENIMMSCLSGLICLTMMTMKCSSSWCLSRRGRRQGKPRIRQDMDTQSSLRRSYDLPFSSEHAKEDDRLDAGKNQTESYRSQLNFKEFLDSKDAIIRLMKEEESVGSSSDHAPTFLWRNDSVTNGWQKNG